MKFYFFSLVFLVTLACNRPANQQMTEVRPEREKVIPKQLGEPELEDEKDPELGDEELGKSPRLKNSGRTPTPKYVVDELSGEKLPTVLVELRQTPCLDTCPDFTVQLLADYTFRYYGRANVELLGEFTGKANFNPLLQLKPLVARTSFFLLQEIYPATLKSKIVARPDGSLPFGTPATITTIDLKGRKKTVIHVSEGPTGLIDLEREILSWIERTIWTPVKD